MKRFLCAVISLGALAFPALADTWAPSTATTSAYIRAGGPTLGGAYFDLENNGNAANFRCYGVLEFDPFLFGLIGPVGNVTGLTLNTADTKSSFSTAGTFGVYFITDSITALSALTYDSTAAGGVTALGGVNQSQFGVGTTFYYIGTGSYTPVKNGNPLTFNFTPDPTAGAAIADAINDGEILRFLFTPDNTAGTQAITLAGTSNGATFGGPPMLGGTFVAVPEPGTCVLLGLGLGVVMLLRRRARAA